MKTPLPLLVAGLSVAGLCATPAAAQDRPAGGPIWSCTVRGVELAPPIRAPARMLTFSFTSGARNLAAFGAKRACVNSYPARTVPGSCALVGCRLVRP